NLFLTQQLRLGVFVVVNVHTFSFLSNKRLLNETRSSLLTERSDQVRRGIASFIEGTTRLLPLAVFGMNRVTAHRGETSSASSSETSSVEAASRLMAMWPVRVMSVIPIGRSRSINVSTFSLFPDASTIK